MIHAKKIFADTCRRRRRRRRRRRPTLASSVDERILPGIDSFNFDQKLNRFAEFLFKGNATVVSSTPPPILTCSVTR